MRQQIFDIQAFSLHDGPGIRTTVFLKGCPLKCKWCSNPEGIDPEPTLSYKKSKCSNCLKCVEICSTGALTAVEGQLVVQHKKCNGCGDCIEVCPTDALKLYGYQATPQEIIDQIKKDRKFFDKSDGGITLSGGEVMMQTQFATEILKLAKEEEIHTCIETCGFAGQKEFTAILKYVDNVLFDYKITDSDEHKYYTGRSNKMILNNLKFLCENGTKIILRIPIIPGINDTTSHFEAITEISNQYENIIKVEVLPYHNWGGHKYHEIGIMPDLEIDSTSTEMADQWVSKLKNMGCKNVVKN